MNQIKEVVDSDVKVCNYRQAANFCVLGLFSDIISTSFDLLV
jgi:hypothetical protein